MTKPCRVVFGVDDVGVSLGVIVSALVVENVVVSAVAMVIVLRSVDVRIPAERGTRRIW